MNAFMRTAFYLLALICFGIGIATSLPLCSAFQIGGDESAEFIKAYLWSQDFPLYSVVWNNQPPLHTALLGTLFKLFGGTVCVARAGALCFGISLVTALFLIVKQRSGWLAGLVAASCVVMAPHTLTLGVSAMLELPAIGTALWSFWFVRKAASGRRALWLILSGVSLGVALQIKLTAAVIGPALFVEVAALCSGASWRERARMMCADTALITTSTLAAFLTIALLLGGSYEQMWAFFFSPQLKAYLKQHAEYQFSFQALPAHREGWMGALAGLILIMMRKRWRLTIAPLVLLSVVLFIHILHRPWWWYYYLHFAVPLAWLTGDAVAELIRSLRHSGQNRGAGRRWIATGATLVMAILAWQMASLGCMRLLREWDNIQHLPRAEDDMIVTKMKEHKQGTKWAYAKDAAYPFHAGINVIPELAVLPRNRFWAEKISEHEVAVIIARYRPEQLLLQGSEHALQKILSGDYAMVLSNETHRLYVRQPKTLPALKKGEK